MEERKLGFHLKDAQGESETPNNLLERVISSCLVHRRKMNLMKTPLTPEHALPE
jgi:hypothetical protein